MIEGECLITAGEILENWDEVLPKFWHVYPTSEAEAPEVSGIPAGIEEGVRESAVPA